MQINWITLGRFDIEVNSNDRWKFIGIANEVSLLRIIQSIYVYAGRFILKLEKEQWN